MFAIIAEIMANEVDISERWLLENHPKAFEALLHDHSRDGRIYWAILFTVLDYFEDQFPGDSGVNITKTAFKAPTGTPWRTAAASHSASRN